MKKNFLGLAAIPLLALLAASCAQESVETGGEGAITFGVATGKQTLSRAAEMNTGSLEADGNLTVWTYNGTTLHETFDLTYSDGAWTYSPVAYHPAASLKHFSVWPSDLAENFTCDGTDASFDYDAKANDKDLMVAGTTTTQADTEADLTFTHILSQINFAIKGQDQIKISVQNIQINDIPSAGTYTFDGVTTGAWSDLGTAEDFPYTPAVTAATTGSGDSEVIYLGNNTQTPSLANTNALMMIPHTLGAAETLTLEYQITDMNGNSLIPAGELTGTGNAWKPAEVQLNTLLEATAWEQSKRYLYVLNFDNPANPLTFTVEVVTDGWVDYDGAGAVVPVEQADHN